MAVRVSWDHQLHHISPPSSNRISVLRRNRWTTEERKEVLARHIAVWLSEGYRVESQGEFQAVLLRGHRVKHILHLIITLITGGIWAIVWIGLGIFGGEERDYIYVDEGGNPHVSRL